jgi:transposase
MEPSVGPHFVGRALREQGHEVRLIPAQFVRPFVKSNKNDYRDTEAIAEAVERENIVRLSAAIADAYCGPVRPDQLSPRSAATKD